MSQFLHLLHWWINVCNEICLFGSNSNVEVDVHELVVHVRLGISISFDDSFIASAETKGLDWKTHELPKCSWGESLAILGFTTANFPLFRNPKNFPEDFLVCVFRSRKCGFSIGALFPTIIVVRIFWNFRVEFNSKLVCCWWEGTWQGNMHVSSTFFFVISMWSWLVLNDGFGFAFGSYCIGRWSGTFVAMHGLWCDANCAASLNWLMWFVESHGHFVGASMFRRGLTEVQWFGWDVVFSITLWMPASFLSPKSRWWVLFETLFCSLRFANNHMLCQRIVFGEQEYSWRWRAYDLDLGLDMTLQPANLLRWEFQFLRPARTTHLRCRCRTRTTWKCTNDEPHLYP